MKEKIKISVDITKQAFDLLCETCELNQRSRSYVINKMILATLDKKEKAEQKPKKKAVNYPSNWLEQFERLWIEKGRKGSKQRAKECYKKLLINASVEECEQLTAILINDIKNHLAAGELGFEELHLTTYINQKRWEK